MSLKVKIGNMTFNDKRYLLCSIARKYVRQLRYEIDELVNEAWLVENVRVQTDLKNFCMAAHWAMIRYMRSQEKRNCKKYRIRTQPLIVGDNFTIEPEVIPFNNVDSKDEFRWMFYGLTPRQRLVIDLRMEDFTLADIGKKLGVTRERVRQIEAKAYRVMRKRSA